MVHIGKILKRLLVRRRIGIILAALLLLAGLYRGTYSLLISRVRVVNNVRPSTIDINELCADDEHEHHKGKCCDAVIHIGIVCAGYNASRDVVTAIKSLLFYRSVILHIHFVVDPPAEKILRTLFRTWNIPDLTVSYYSSHIPRKRVYWIPNSHYSGIYGLLKLSILDVLPNELQKIIVLDIDLIFLSDIAELWDMFTKFGTKQAIGVAENQSDWYLGNITTKNPWPAIGRGFNTGVMLLDLNKLRNINWNTLWINVTTIGLKNHNNTALADQDIVNAVMKIHDEILFTLPCTWNVQLSTFSRARLCYRRDFSMIKVLHWNAPRRLKSLYNPLFLYQYFASFSLLDSNYLQKPMTKCKPLLKNNHDFISAIVKTDFCQSTIDDASKLRRVHLYFMDFDDQKFHVANDVTLVTHLSMDHISLLEMIASHWIGPISVAIYITERESIELKNLVLNSPLLSIRKNIGYHLVFSDIEDMTYPINLLRNISLQETITDFVFLCDSDSVPSRDLYQYLTQSVLTMTHKSNKTAYVVAPFEKLFYGTGNDIPQNKSILLRDWDSQLISPLGSHQWDEGHCSINYTKWRYSFEQYHVLWSKDYQPNIVVSKSDCPNFDQRFFGFGWNKVSHVMELEAAGFQFSVLPYGFIVHIAYFTNPDLNSNSKDYQDCVSSLKLEFIKNLVDRYQVNPDRYT